MTSSPTPAVLPDARAREIAEEHGIDAWELTEQPEIIAAMLDYAGECVAAATPPASYAAVPEGFVLAPVELRALSDRATPGPWAWEQCGEKEDVPVIGIAFPGDDPDCKTPYEGEFRDSDASRMTIACDWQACDGHSPSANAAFAVAAVNYVRVMLAAAPKVASEVQYQGCNRPPDGWWCCSEPGHDGPCPTRQIGEL